MDTSGGLQANGAASNPLNSSAQKLGQNLGSIPRNKEGLVLFLQERTNLIRDLLHTADSWIQSFYIHCSRPADEEHTYAPDPWIYQIMKSLLAINGTFILESLLEWAKASSIQYLEADPNNAGGPDQSLIQHLILLGDRLERVARIRGWEAKTDNGQIYFVYQPTNMMTWLDPRYTSFPSGWKISNGDIDGNCVFADITTGQTSIADPRLYPHLMRPDQAGGRKYEEYHSRTCTALPPDYRAVHIDGESFFLDVRTGSVVPNIPEAISTRAESASSATSQISIQRNTNISQVSNQGAQILESYPYQPLAVLSFRVLILKNGKENLTCSIHHTTLNSSLQYAALSYEWGSGEKDQKLIVEDDHGGLLGYVDITDTLSNALRNIAGTDSLPNVVFADQVSINQNDRIELGHQVALMGSVYSNATIVVTYDPGTCADLKKGVELLQEIHQHFEPHFQQIWDTITVSETEIMSVFNDFMQRMGQFPKFIIQDEIALHSMRRLMWGAWTRRLWIAPENMVNSNTVFLFDKYLLPWLAVIGIYLCNWTERLEFRGSADLSHLSNPDDEDELYSYSISQVCFARLSQVEGFDRVFPKQPFWSAVVNFSNLKCTDARDKVYGLFTLATTEERLHMDIIPSYSDDNSVHDVYKNFARAVIYFTDDLRLLNWTELLQNRDDPTWISWVPDFRVPRLEQQYMFSFEKSLIRRSQCRFESNRLHVSGVVVGTLKTKADDCCPGSIRDVDMYRQLLEAIEFIKPHLSQLTDVDLYSKIARALTCVEGWVPKSCPSETSPAAFALQSLLQIWQTKSTELDEEYSLLLEEQKEAAHALNEEIHISGGRSLFITDNQEFGTCSSLAEPGDLVVNLFGASNLTIIRLSGEEEYKFVGSAFIEGLSNDNCLKQPYNTRAFALI